MGAHDQRPRFYEGQFLSAEDLHAIVTYFRDTAAQLALGTHLWGIGIGLHLTERPAPGAANRVEVLLQPGMAWDGFGRVIDVQWLERLQETLFEGIAYNIAVDDPASPGGAKGRLVRVWLAYGEIAARTPAPGFEACTDDAQNARVRETFRFVIGDQPNVVDRRAPVTIGDASVDAEQALKHFDAAAPLVHDTSIPHQSYPSGDKPPRWLVPIGLVRWIARDGTLGYFAKLDLDPADHAPVRSRALRRYVGAVAEEVVAAAGSVVVRHRDADPLAPHQYARLLGNSAHAAQAKGDLLWIQGQTRALGHVKLANAELHWRDADGADQGTPLYLKRTGDNPAGGLPGQRDLRAYLGPVAQNDNRVIVGPIGTAAPPAGTPLPIEPRWVVVSGRPGAASEGRAGVNTLDPKAALEVKGDWTANEDGALRLSGATPTVRFEDALATWRLQVGAASAGSFRVGHRTGPGNWTDVVYVARPSAADPKAYRVGIKTGTPQAPLSVRGEAGTWEELVSFEDSGGAPKWHIQMHTVGGKHLHIGEHGVADARLYLKAGGDVGVGTSNPLGRMTVEGKIPSHGRLTFFSGSADFEYNGGNDGLFVFRDTGGLTAFMGTKFGIGTSGARARLEVAGAADTWGTAAFTPDPAKGGHISHVHWDATGDWYIRSAASNGRVIIQDTGGNVGIGTTAPSQKLHVAGAFVRVDGAGNEQAYLGGDGAGNDMQLGSMNAAVGRVALWNTSAAQRMDLFCRDINCDDITFSGLVLPSDASLKRDIKTIDAPLETLLKLRGVQFTWRQGTRHAGESDLGVVAQEVAAVLPQLVHESPKGLAVSYLSLVPLLLESVKALKGEIDRLNDRVRALEPAPASKPRPTSRRASKR